MKRCNILSGSPFEALAGYSRAVVAGDWIIVSGTVGADPQTGAMPPTAGQQARNIFTIIERALARGEASLADVVRCGVFITGPEHLEAVAAALAEKFGRVRPANTTIICRLPVPGALVEIEVMALRGARVPLEQT